MVPKPYSVRWTAKLIRRDFKAVAAKCTSKIRHMFSSTAATATATPTFPSNITQEDTDSIANGASVLADVSEGYDRSSFITYSIDDNDSITPSESTGMVVAEVTDTGAANAEIANLTVTSGTFYSFLSASLKDLYASRDRDLPLQQRWVFRGSWLLLHLATQYCSSNPTYDICKGLPSKPAEKTSPSEDTRKCAPHVDYLMLTLSEDHKLLAPMHTVHPRVSQMPAMVHARHKEDHRRHDSLFSNFSRQTHPPDSSKHMWYTICAGALEHTKTVLAAETLLSHIGVEKDASAMLEVIGNPAKRLSDEDQTELQRRLGQMLYPELFG